MAVKRADVPWFEGEPGGLVTCTFDVQRLGIWVRFVAKIEERPVEGGAPRPVVVAVSATDDDGEVVPIGKSEHATMILLFLQTYYRWRRHECRNLPAPTGPC